LCPHLNTNIWRDITDELQRLQVVRELSLEDTVENDES